MKRSRLLSLQARLNTLYNRLTIEVAEDGMILIARPKLAMIVHAIGVLVQVISDHRAATLKTECHKPCEQSTLDCVQSDTDRCVIVLGPAHLEKVHDAITATLPVDDPFRVTIEDFYVHMLCKGFN